jgi:hypothetical protein
VNSKKLAYKYFFYVSTENMSQERAGLTYPFTT